MKISCEKAALVAALNAASRVVSPKSSLQVLEGILLEAGTDASITGYDLKTGIRAVFPATIIEKGSIVLVSGLFSGIIKKLPDSVVTITTDEKFITKIKCGMSEFSIMGLSAEDFPNLPTVDSHNYLEIPQNLIKSMINDTVFAVSTNEASRIIHTGALFTIEGDTITVVCLDGFRLAIRKERPEKATLHDCKFVVPAAALSEVQKLASDEDDPVRVTVGSKHIIFEFEDTTLVSRKLEGEFLDYKKTIPIETKYNYTADRREVLNSVERVSLIISDRIKSPLHVIFGDGSIEFNVTTSLGSSRDCCAAGGFGENTEVGFNNRYLLDMLKAAPDDKIKLMISGSVSPLLVKPVDDDDDKFTYMLLPVRIKAGD